MSRAPSTWLPAGCLVSDGYRVYALTARHVVGNKGEVVFVRLRVARQIRPSRKSPEAGGWVAA
jgi:hypothetical protein